MDYRDLAHPSSHGPREGRPLNSLSDWLLPMERDASTSTRSCTSESTVQVGAWCRVSPGDSEATPAAQWRRPTQEQSLSTRCAGRYCAATDSTDKTTTSSSICPSHIA